MAEEWKNDAELLDMLRAELFTSVIADTLDAHGYVHQMLPPNIRPQRIGMRACGRAMTVLETDSVDPQEPFGVLFHALDALKPNDIYIASGASSAYSMFGELMTTAAIRRGAVARQHTGGVFVRRDVVSVEPVAPEAHHVDRLLVGSAGIRSHREISRRNEHHAVRAERRDL